MRRVQQDKETYISRLAEEHIRRGARYETTAAVGQTDGSTVAVLPIQDPDGALLFMCGVSVCGGEDVCGR